METLTETAPIEVTTPITPSEALRLGRLIRPVHGQGTCFSGTDTACAIGAIALGWGYDGPLDESVGHRAYPFVKAHGLDAGPIWSINDEAIEDGRDPDGAVLDYLARLGQ